MEPNCLIKSLNKKNNLPYCYLCEKDYTPINGICLLNSNC